MSELTLLLVAALAAAALSGWILAAMFAAATFILKRHIDRRGR